MALRKIIEAEGKAVIHTPSGTIDNGIQRVSFSAYVKVTSINGDKDQINANVRFTGDVAEFNKQYRVPVSVETGSANFIEQVYKHLKMLPEFAGAEDC
tara:strand:- start:921 stop:1214 length:294 start_codon:yes stop_codon:yes gene_type:complete